MADLFRSILVPHDFSPPATHALRLAADLASPRSRLVVLHVVIPYPVTGISPGELPYIPPESLASAAKQRLEALVRRTLGARRRVESRVVVGDPAGSIVDAARRATCVVMATRGRTGLAHLLIGSVAEKVVRHSPRPVLTVHATPVSRRARAPRRRRAAPRRRKRAAHRS
jgi:nucleotide-binding universal stress UspA family protein